MNSSIRSLAWIPLLGALACTGSPSDTLDADQADLAPSATLSFQDGVSPTSGYRGTSDAMIREDEPNATLGAISGVGVDARNGAHKRQQGLLRFALGGIPPGSTVTAVKLRLHVSNPTNRKGFSLLALSHDWSESEVNWGVSSIGTAWHGPGATGSRDFDDTVLGTLNPTSEGVDTTALNAAGVKQVQAWVNHPDENFGFLIRAGSDGDAVGFASSDALTPANRPELLVTYRGASAGGSGLRGEYFSDDSLQNVFRTRVDDQLDFNWGMSAPLVGMPAQHWSARWTGTVVPTQSEAYTFTTVSDDGARVWVNDKLVIDAWKGHSARRDSGKITLKAGTPASLRVEYRQDAKNAELKLLWSSAHVQEKILPQVRLHPAVLQGEGNTPIKYVVVLIKENHTFENYFTGFPGATFSMTADSSKDKNFNRPHLTGTGTMDRSLDHSHFAAVKAFSHGKLDALNEVVGNGGDKLAYGYYGEDEIPNYWAYARNFVLADHVFSNTFGPSFPGHFAFISGFNVLRVNPEDCYCGMPCTQSNAIDPVSGDQGFSNACYNKPSIVNELPAGYTWSEYGFSALRSIKSVAEAPGYADHVMSAGQLQEDLAHGAYGYDAKKTTQTPQRNLIVAHLNGGKDNEHPPHGPCKGENSSVDYLNAIMNGPHWKETAVIITWDDWGGWYDSVASRPDAMRNGDYMGPGFRVPLILVSPYARKGFVLKTRAEQSSVLKTIEDLWGMERLHDHDTAINDDVVGSLIGGFDFKQRPRDPFILKTHACPE